ncbi:MAG: glycosyl hydrolase [Acidobacteriota bacterium]|nr:glycosyl hydrolase [Acidobacteriota bacterium]
MRLLKIAALLALLPGLLGTGFAQDKKKEDDKSKMKAGTFAGLKMRNIGPALMAGRISDIAIDHTDRATWYVAVGSGGVWKTTNAGTTWSTIFDKQGSYSIGCVTIDPNRPEVVWVGTGENVGGRHVGYGDGIYRSMDSGKTWKNMGLKESEHIGNIIIDPRDSNVLYVAVQGPLWSPGGDRGLYKTTDGGTTWEMILGGGEWTGVNEVHFDPRNPDVLYASTHQKHRTVAALVNGGPESAIHKSWDGGKTWTKLGGGLPGGDLGKIGLAVSTVNPDVVYATIEAMGKRGGLYRSTNAGGTWEKRNDFISGGTGAHYYQEIFASPHNVDVLYQMAPRIMVTRDGGKTMTQLGEPWKHGDSHAMGFDPDDPGYMIVGSDGGLYESWDKGRNWKFHANMPITQFYKVAVDYDEPFYNLYGGTQDNNTQGGPSRTMNVNGIRNSDWFITLFADGHQPAVDPTNPDIVYSEWQQGNLVRYDRKNGEIVYIKPQPEPGDPPDRFNWDTPILISPHDPARLYYASQRLFRSDDRGDSWKPISGDLTRNQDRFKMPMMNKIQSIDAIWDLFAMSYYNTITSISESPKQDGLIYIGTDDGLIQVTEDGGNKWRKIDVKDLPGLPEMSFINDIKADLHDKDTVYVVLDNHKTGDFKPYVYKSTNRGKKWTSIAGDLPDRHICWRIVQDHVNKDLLFMGTEFGVFFTVDGGKKWVKLTGGVPNIPFRDLVIQTRENDLVGATFGRSFFILDDYTPLRQASEKMLKEEATLFTVKDAHWYIPKRPLGRPGKATQGAAFYVAENPPFGAVFTYYLADGYKTRKQKRQAAEKKAIKEGKGAPRPEWDELREEDLEEKPAVILTVRDDKGQVVRHVKGRTGKGFHRVAWDLRYPNTNAWSPRQGSGFRRMGDPESGNLAAPGNYSVTLYKRIEGKLTQLSEPQNFVVKPLIERALKGMEPAELVAFTREFDEASRAADAAGAVIRSLAQRLGAVKSVLSRATMDHGAIFEEVVAMERKLDDVRELMSGNRQMEGVGEATAPGIRGRMGVVGMSMGMSTYGPTPTHLRQFEIAKEGLAKVRTMLNDMQDNALPALEKKLDEAGLPWTPGRSVPSGN